jgi:class 3 adenylate cyclase
VVYKPKPIDTTGVTLPESLEKLTEALAENSHDLWAKGRMAQGWSYGPERDDKEKTHPDLVPYGELPDSEKAYDRVTAMEALKAIIALGYEIVPPDKVKSSRSGDPDDFIRDMAGRLRRKGNLDPKALLDMWAILRAEREAGDSGVYALLGNRILKAGEPLLSYDVIAEGLKLWPQDVRLRQLQGLALARSGATVMANQVLSGLYGEGMIDGETLGILARTHKDMAGRARSHRERKRELERAHAYYVEGYKGAISGKQKGWRDDALYNGINAASTALLTGKKGEAKTLAGEVRRICLENLELKKRDYWPVATLGEAAVLLGDWKEAETRYREAGRLGRKNFGDLSSTRHQARTLLTFLRLDPHRFDHCFSIPKVVVFSGHMVDWPGRPVPRFPQSMVESVRVAIGGRLDRLDAGIGFASAACGADLLFLEAMLDRGGEITVVLPFEVEAFCRHSVDIIPGADWGLRFDRVLEQAKSVVLASDRRYSANDIGYQYANLLMHGLAILRAEHLDTELVPLAFWDGGPGDGPWGTASFVSYWHRRGVSPDILDEKGLRDQGGLSAPSSQGKRVRPSRPATSGNADGREQVIRALLFADVVGYSSLSDEQVPKFVDHFMGLIAEAIAESPVRPLTRNTWGDALYFVFRSPGDAGRFALELRDRIRKTNWRRKGLPENLNLRISLHAGPVYRRMDPVIRKTKYTGSHTSRAARIEPITPPGEIYASQAFAALAAARDIEDFSLEYVGLVPLPKNAGTVPLYLVRGKAGRH